MIMTDSTSHCGPQVNALLPRSADLIEAFCGGSDNGSAEQPLVRMAESMAEHHQRQWVAEDDSRAATDASEAAQAKRLIDELNTRRVELVEQIDGWVAAQITSDAEASLHTETLGSVIDRLAIAWVRANRLSPTARGDHQLARDALRQLAELADAYDDLVRDLGSGQRRLPAWRLLKRYGPRQ